MSNLQKFNTILEDFNKEVGKLKAVSEAYQKLDNLTHTYGEISNHFTRNNQKLENINQSIENSLVSIGKLLEEKTDLIRKENKDFYKDFEGTIRIKLDDNKSEIKNLIESERYQLKQIFEIEFTKNTNDLKRTFEIETNKQIKAIIDGLKPIKLSVWLIGGLTLLINILIAIKLFSNLN